MPNRLLSAALVLTLAPVGLSGQADRETRSGVHGIVIDAASGLPLEGVWVTLEPAPSGLVVNGQGGSTGFLSAVRQFVTGLDGAYAFAGVGPGAYRLRVVRLGYRSRALEVHYEGPADPRISVGLEVEALQLEPIPVVTSPLTPMGPGRASTSTDENDRVALERLRQSRLLTPDARILTDHDVVEAATLAETDLLRALQRLPGVTADDDWSAEPWTRGSRWDETRVYFDGLPLFDPMHGGGAFASINPDAIGSMTFHPGVRPVDAGDGSAGVVDLRTRSAPAGDHLTALGQASILAARMSVDRPFAAGGGLTLSARRSHFDEISRLGDDVSDHTYIPYRFTDVTGRWDQPLGDSTRLEVSGMVTHDRVLGDIPYALKGARGAWGNGVTRATLESARHGVRTRISVGGSRFSADVQTASYDPGRLELEDAETAAATQNAVSSELAEITVAPLSAGGGPTPWQLGARWTWTGVDFLGPAPWPYPDAANAGVLSYHKRVTRAAYWGQLRRALGPRLELSAGLRLDVPDLDRRVGDLTASPRVALAWSPNPDVRVSAGLGRHYQYEQAIAAAGFTFGPALGPGHLWVVAHDDLPALRADIASAGIEAWLPGGWLTSATAYLRETSGRLTPRPDSGYVQARPAVVNGRLGDGWAVGTGEATGLELSARKLAGRWTGSVAYSLVRSRTTASGVTYPTPGARTHALDATFALKWSEHTTVGAALTATSGAPYTRFYNFRCAAVTWYCPQTDIDRLPTIGWAESAGAERTSGYLSLDLQVERTGHVFGLPVGGYGQLRNALDRRNRAAYVGSVGNCDDSGENCTVTDNFEDGFPILPLIGFWVRM